MWLKQSLLLLFTAFFCCSVYSQENDNNRLFEQPGYSFPYQLNKPDKSWELPKKLVEISGLSSIDKHQLACVQDEKASIYIFNTKKGDVERKIDFGDKGDFEGLEIVGDDAWVLKSNGTLYQVKDFLKGGNPKVKKHKTALSKKNNAEGLAYDSQSQSLLIACKAYPWVDEDEQREAKEFKTVYRFRLKTKKLDAQPFLLIEMDSIKQYKNYNTATSLGIELLAFLDASDGDVSFQPSGIAVHPVTGNLYVLASVGNVLAVFSREGRMKALVHLKATIHRQPEGICFGPDATLYLSNEGGNGKGTIQKFHQKEKM
ncbi:MAG: SdiA-regulated domain-containing protein [Bacteroidales bacterium]|nr:SdiA-regulated domain-containing protein [Bacteroidales bacterium]